MASVTDIFLTNFEIIKFLMIYLKDVAEFLETKINLTKFSIVDLEDFLSVYSMFWNKFSDFRKILIINLEVKRIKPKLLDTISETFEAINAILYDDILMADPEEKKEALLQKFSSMAFNDNVHTLNEALQEEKWKPIDINFEVQEMLHYILFKCLDEGNLLAMEEEEPEIKISQAQQLLNATQVIHNARQKAGQDRDIVVIKKEIHVEGEKYLVTESFVCYLRNIHRCLKMMEIMKQNNAEELIMKNIIEQTMVSLSSLP